MYENDTVLFVGHSKRCKNVQSRLQESLDCVMALSFGQDQMVVGRPENRRRPQETTGDRRQPQETAGETAGESGGPQETQVDTKRPKGPQDNLRHQPYTVSPPMTLTFNQEWKQTDGRT